MNIKEQSFKTLNSYQGQNQSGSGGPGGDKKGDKVTNCQSDNSVKNIYRLHQKHISALAAATWLAQLGERRSAEWEVAGSNPSWTNTQGLEITGEKVLSLY